MSKPLVMTHAGDDSDGKIWGIEGINLLFILAGLLLGVGVAMMLFRHHAPLVSAAGGLVPIVIASAYVFGLRQGKPRAYDTDLLETLAGCSGWAPSRHQPRNPLHRS